MTKKTNPSCPFYNWGGNPEKGYPSYPRIYGARCEKEKEFFERDAEGNLKPDCSTCSQTLKEKPL